MSPEHRHSYYQLTTDTTWYALTAADVALLQQAREAGGQAPLVFAEPVQPPMEYYGHLGDVDGCAECASQGPHVVEESAKE